MYNIYRKISFPETELICSDTQRISFPDNVTISCSDTLQISFPEFKEKYLGNDHDTGYIYLSTTTIFVLHDNSVIEHDRGCIEYQTKKGRTKYYSSYETFEKLFFSKIKLIFINKLVFTPS